MWGRFDLSKGRGSNDAPFGECDCCGRDGGRGPRSVRDSRCVRTSGYRAVAAKACGSWQATSGTAARREPSVGFEAESAQPRTSSRSATEGSSSSAIRKVPRCFLSGRQRRSPTKPGFPRPSRSPSTSTAFGSAHLRSPCRCSRVDRSYNRTIRAYADQVATALAAVHDISTRSLPSSLRSPHRIDALDPAATPRAGHLAPSTVERVTAVLTKARDALVAEERVLVHGDFHPGNLIWSRDRLTGIVDWSGTRPGPPQWELGCFRVELTVLLDRRAANAILTSYQEMTGHEAVDQPIWDLVHVLDSHTTMHSWLAAYREQGRDLDLDIARRRLRCLAHSLLADVGG